MTESPRVLERRPDVIRSARTSCAWVDRTGHAVVTATGSDRVDLLHRLSTNDLTGMKPGQGKGTVLLTEKARIIDVLTLLHGEDATTILGSVGTGQQIVTWLKKYIIMDDVRLKDISSTMDMIEICGPRAADVVKELTELDVSTLPLHHWRFVGTPELSIVRMPSVVELSYLLFGPIGSLDEIRSLLTASEENIPHLNESEAEFLRVIGGMGKIGHEWSDAYNPLEAGLLHLTSFSKGCYIGQEVVARLDSYNKVKQRIMGIRSSHEIGEGDEIVVDGVVIGKMTSVVASLTGDEWCGLGYVRGEHANAGTRLKVRHTGEEVDAVQQLLPMEV